MPQKIEFTITPENSGRRLDAAVTDYCVKNNIEMTRSSIKSRDIKILMTGKEEKPSCKVKAGDVVSFEIPDSKTLELTPQDVAFDIVYADRDVAVVSKPYGLVVHPSKGHSDNTLVNGLLYRLKDKLSSIGGVERPGIVHRLDRDTAGLMIVALNDRSHHQLTEDFKNRRVHKIYHAIVKGKLDKSGRIDAPIGRSEHDRKKMAVRENGKQAITEYKVLEYLKDHCYIEINLLTGRTHQIRVHFSDTGHPVAGDPLYSRNSKSYHLPGLALCAKKLEFLHPVTLKKLSFEIDLPEEFRSLLERLRN